MNYGKIFKRAWQILWRYPALWFFGFLLALTGGSGSSGGGGGSSQNGFHFNQNDFNNREFLPNNEFGRQMQHLFDQVRDFFQTTPESTIIAWVVGIVLGLILLGIIFTIIRYVSFAGSIRMVNHYEESEEKVSIGQGWRWGWSRSALRLWLIDLVVMLPVFVAFIILMGCAALPILLGASAGGNKLGVPAIIAGVGLAFFALFVIIIAALFIRVWLQYAHISSVVQEQGVFDSLRAAWKIMRTFWKDTVLVWLINFGVRIAVMIVSVPIILLILAIVVVISGAVGFLWYSAAAAVSVGMILTVLLLFILLMVIPVSFVQGFSQIYFLNVWILVYRETQAKQQLKSEPVDILPEPTG